MGIVKTKSFGLAVNESGDGKARKLAIVLPGKLDTKDYSHMRSHVEYLAGRGYLAVSFDPPGTWESEGDISLYTLSNYADSIDELIDYYGNKPTFLVGHSMGGSVSMMVGTRNPYVIGFSSIMSSSSYKPGKYTDYPDETWKRNGYRESKRDIPGENKYIEFNLPYTFLEDRVRFDVKRDLSNCPKPKLFVYGQDDRLVEPDIVKEAYEVSAEPKEIASIGGGHDYRYHPVLVQEVNGILGKFISKYEGLR